MSVHDFSERTKQHKTFLKKLMISFRIFRKVIEIGLFRKEFLFDFVKLAHLQLCPFWKVVVVKAYESSHFFHAPCGNKNVIPIYSQKVRSFQKGQNFCLNDYESWTLNKSTFFTLNFRTSSDLSLKHLLYLY